MIVSLKGSEVVVSQDSLLTFFVIASGAVSCAVGGLLSYKIGCRAVAAFALIGSGTCCITLIIVQSANPVIWTVFTRFLGYSYHG